MTHKTANTMKFSEKDLENLIYNNPERMDSKGLLLNTIGRRLGYCQLLQQVCLGSYGTADLINIEYVKIDFNPPGEHQFHRRIIITIIECKLNSIDINAYMQAKRYETAIRRMLEDYDLSTTMLEVKTVLIGDSINKNGDFVFVHANDKNCSIYTYEYGIDGIQFTEVGREWHKPGSEKAEEKLKSEFIEFIQNCYWQHIHKNGIPSVLTASSKWDW